MGASLHSGAAACRPVIFEDIVITAVKRRTQTPERFGAAPASDRHRHRPEVGNIQE